MKVFAVISHTHWDREWYQSFEQFQLRLVDLIDRCLKILEDNPTYIFHLDAQTIVLEDYLEIRPSKYIQLKQYIQEKRLLVGPWYVQNDFYLTSGESTIRNLLEGIRIAESFGYCAKVGYAPDQFGNISQIPQIFNDFHLTSFVFGRGYCEIAQDENGESYRKKTKAEFIWQGADGSEILAVHLPYWYNNAQRFSSDREKSKLLLQVCDRLLSDRVSTPFYLLMNGVDHLEAQADLLPILDDLNQTLPDSTVKQYSLETYIEHIKQYLSEQNITLPVHKGALRMGGDGELLKGTLSSRIYLKQQNVALQNLLECRLEPLYAMAVVAGGVDSYPIEHMQYLWKKLIKNHPHDSICGCSIDAVHRHMQDRFSRISDSAHTMLDRGLSLITEHFYANGEKNDYLITVTNTTEAVQSNVVSVTLDFPITDHVTNFTISQLDGSPVSFAIRSHVCTVKDTFTPLNLPGCIDIDRYEIVMLAENVNPMAVKGYIVHPIEGTPAMLHDISNNFSELITMENSMIKLEIDPNGNIYFTDKVLQRKIENPFYFEETADRGDSYIYFKTNDTPTNCYLTGGNVVINEWNTYAKSCAISKQLNCRKCYNFETSNRSIEMVTCTLSLTLLMQQGSPFLQCKYAIDNQAYYHRIRFCVNTGIPSDSSVADTPFDIIRSDHTSHYIDTMSRVLPNTSFAAIEANQSGLAVFTKGTHEYEHIEPSILAFTVLRGTGIISRNAVNMSSNGGAQWDCPENQCIGSLSGEFGILPYQNDCISADIPRLSKQFRNPLIAHCEPFDITKLSRGRAAVQDTRLEENFYLSDAYPQMCIADNQSAFEISGKGIVVSCFKAAENASGLIIRLVNLAESDVIGRLKIKGYIYRTDMSEQSRTFLANDCVTLPLRKKEIITLFISQNLLV